MEKSIPPHMLLAESFAEVDWSQFYRLNTKRYAAHYLTSTDANTLPWSAFRLNDGVIGAATMSGTDLGTLIVAKSVTWSDRDVNIYTGSSEREIRFFLDLSEDEFVSVFSEQIRLISQLSVETREDVYCTHGFNPLDTSPDGHSVRSRLHTHVHIPGKIGRIPLDGRVLSVFEKMILIEPFSQIFWDYAVSEDTARFMEGWAPQRSNGFISLIAPRHNLDSHLLRGIYGLMLATQTKYDEAATIFTTGLLTESMTGFDRYIPRSLQHRRIELKRFLHQNRSWLSPKSRALLSYLGEYVRVAQPRDPENWRHLRSGPQLWIAKGFAGAINFVASAQQDTVKFDFAPRIISTAGAERVLSDSPTIIIKDDGLATAEDRRRMRDFEAQVVRILLSQM